MINLQHFLFFISNQFIINYPSERNSLSNFQDKIIFSKQQDKLIQKLFQNVQLFSINPIKCLNVYADSQAMKFKKIVWFLTNSIQYVNDECWKSLEHT